MLFLKELPNSYETNLEYIILWIGETIRIGKITKLCLRMYDHNKSGNIVDYYRLMDT
jgi:hypothetical protein